MAEFLHLNLINWPWLEDLLVRAGESEIAAFARQHRDEVFFAFCLEHEGLTAALTFSYGTYGAVADALQLLRGSAADSPPYCRNVELRPRFWRYRWGPDPERDPTWGRIASILGAHEENMRRAEKESEVLEFQWLRFEYLAECVVARLQERGAFRALPCETEFIAFAANEHESLEELEDRLERAYPDYRRAAVEWSGRVRPAHDSPQACEDPSCTRKRGRLARCTACHFWFCEACRAGHLHPELFRRQPLLNPPSS